MIVETYEVNEVAGDGSTDALDEQAVALAEKLGLAGQQKLVAKRGDGARMVIPYNQMTTEEERVYRVLFPQHTDARTFDAGPIPLRVLQVIAWAQEHGSPFARLQVWHKDVGRAKEDPLLVGITEGWPARSFLLARWGDALAPYHELAKEAARVALASLNGHIARLRSELTMLEARAASDPAVALESVAQGGPYYDARVRP
jgi:hypothetical protein